MDEIIEVVLRNPFLLLLLIGGLISFFNNKKSEQKQQEHPMERRHSSPSPVDMSENQQPMETNFDSSAAELDEQKKLSTKQISQEELSFEDEHQGKELDGLQEELEAKRGDYIFELADEKISDLYQGETMRAPIEIKVKKSKLHRHLKKRLTKEGLIESIIMAEVLGPPRSKRSHHRYL